MKEYIEKIIEIILENVSCEHQEIEEFPRGPKIDDPTYFLEDEKAVIEKCIKVIPKMKIDEKFIIKKSKELWDKHFQNLEEYSYTVGDIQDIIRSLLNELAAKISLIGKEIS